MDESNEWNEFNKRFIEAYQANKGQVGGSFQGISFDHVLLLHTTGVKSGLTRLNPLTYMSDGDNYVVLASKGGAPKNPDWYYNIVSNPNVSIEVGADKFEAFATIIKEPERTALYEKMSELYPWNIELQQKTARVIPVVVLIPWS
jgi:deazaflavin-dependent oxidoreductase (nitroreductase family)